MTHRLLPGVSVNHTMRLVLLDLMMSRDALPWPGADGTTYEEVLAAYVPASERGRVPDEAELIRRHPEIAPEIPVFFARAGSPDGGTRPTTGPGRLSGFDDGRCYAVEGFSACACEEALVGLRS